MDSCFIDVDNISYLWISIEKEAGNFSQPFSVIQLAKQDVVVEWASKD